MNPNHKPNKINKAYLAESGHGFIEFDPTISVIDYGEERPEDSRDHIDQNKIGRSIKFLRAKYGYDISTAREHLLVQGLDFDEVLWWEESEHELNASEYPCKPYEFDQKDWINPLPPNALYLRAHKA